MTNQQAIDRVMSRLAERDDTKDRVFPADLLPLIDDALTRFATVVAQDEEKSQLLRKDYTIAVASGTGDLTASFTAAEPFMADFADGAYLVTTGGVQLHYLTDRTQLNLARPSMIPYWTIDKSSLRTRNTDGSLSSLTTTVTATGQYIPLITSVPVQLEDTLIDILEDMIKSRMSGPKNA